MFRRLKPAATLFLKETLAIKKSLSAKLLRAWKIPPDCIISQGTAGGHDPILHKGDIVIGEKLVNVSSLKTKHYGKNQGIHPEEWEINDWDAFENDGKKIPCLYSSPSLVEAAMNTEYIKGKLVKGITSSSNNWNMELDRINHFVKTYGSSCEEMESYAATQIANRFNVPALTIRIISNSEQHPGEEYDRTIGQICQEFVLDVIKKL